MILKEMNYIPLTIIPLTAQFTGGNPKDGGAEEIRTPDPHNAIVVLYQLSYDPIRDGQCRVSFPIVKTILPASGDAGAS